MRAWLKSALSDENDEPSSSRLVMFLWSVALLCVFVSSALWEAYYTHKMPQVDSWTTFLGVSQAGGTLGYLGNQLRKGLK